MDLTAEVNQTPPFFAWTDNNKPVANPAEAIWCQQVEQPLLPISAQSSDGAFGDLVALEVIQASQYPEAHLACGAGTVGLSPMEGGGTG